MLRNFLDFGSYNQLRNLIVDHRPKPTVFVPSDAEVQATLNTLQGDARVMFLSLLYSGLRCTELQHIIRHKLPVQQMSGFVKVSVNWQRGRKNCIFGYFPSDLYAQLKKCRLAVTGFKSQLKKRNLIPAKYCRKVFYTTARSAGAPAEVCDYIQGRSGTSIGQRHYLDGQRMSDQWYPVIIVKLDAICRGKTSKPSKPLYTTRTSLPSTNSAEAEKGDAIFPRFTAKGSKALYVPATSVPRTSSPRPKSKVKK